MATAIARLEDRLVLERGWLATRLSFCASCLEGDNPICLREELRHIGWARPHAVDDLQALLILGRPTGDRASLSDVYGDLVLP
jgi:hypothetical protein